MLVQGVSEEMRTEPTEAAAVACGEILIDLGGALAEISFGTQEGGRGRLGRGVLFFLVEDAAHSGVCVLVVGLGIQHAGVGCADGEQLPGLDGVKEDEVAEDMAFEREQKGMAAALHAFKQVGAAEAHQSFCRRGKDPPEFGLRFATEEWRASLRHSCRGRSGAVRRR